MDNKKKQGYQDDAKIDSRDLSELAYRAKKWRYTAGAIVVAMHVTGSSAARIVKAWLDKNWARILKSK